MADKGYEGDSHPKELFREARGEMVLARKQHILFQTFWGGCKLFKTRQHWQKWPEQDPEDVESKFFCLCWARRRHAEGSTPGRCLSVWITEVMEGRSKLLSCCWWLGRVVTKVDIEEIQKASTAWRGLGLNRAHAGNGELREVSTIIDRQ